MNILNGLKTCRKGLHQYSTDLSYCRECKRIAAKLWRELNPDYQKRQYEKNIEEARRKNRERTRNWCKKNPDKHRENSRKNGKKWRKNNREKAREWRQVNAERMREYNAWRRSLKKQATPPWADREAIKKIYDEARRLEKETGVAHHVDHIYPLNSPYLCGLHVESNLQILTRSENLTKNNKTWPGQLDCQRG
jgi:hypothetical protein